MLEARDYLLEMGRKEKAEAKEDRRRAWADFRAKQAAGLPAVKPSATQSSAPAAQEVAQSSTLPLSASDGSQAVEETVPPPTRGRRRPGSRLPRSFMRALSEDGDADRVNAPGEDGKERFKLEGIEYEEISFEEASLPAERSSTDLASPTASTALVNLGPQREVGCHIVAPVRTPPPIRVGDLLTDDPRDSQCPHEQQCPLASTPDFCHFTQLVEQPFFSRATKNSKVGTIETKMTYFILRRGSRPKVAPESRGEGRIGEVGRELLEKQREKESRRLIQGEGGVFEPREDVEEVVQTPDVDYAKLREESMEWGRMIYPPLIRKDLITADLCSADGKSPFPLCTLDLC